MSRKILKQGDCRVGSQLESPEVRMEFTLTDDGVLTISGNDFLLANIVTDKEIIDGEEFDEERLESQFIGMDFHTAVIMPEVLGLGDCCFDGCPGLDKIIVDESGIYLHTKFVGPDMDVEVTEEDLMPLQIEDQMWRPEKDFPGF